MTFNINLEQLKLTLEKERNVEVTGSHREFPPAIARYHSSELKFTVIPGARDIRLARKTLTLAESGELIEYKVYWNLHHVKDQLALLLLSKQSSGVEIQALQNKSELPR
ncbi:hypothetical protein GX50_04580 [[Emmonsia] crescens]|uniref:Uncharacterized protein n=1 Tax=[Emmonsia] crescens TaxID=73230 RepID=A0A2B7ZF52_9EURO|nr:hypothetical protein GX50_04580 [Emmonsia crescens]